MGIQKELETDSDTKLMIYNILKLVFGRIQKITKQHAMYCNSRKHIHIKEKY